MKERLDVAYRHTHITHIARLDDDDQWAPFHLELMAKAYGIHTKIGFVFSQTAGHKKAGFPKIEIFPVPEEMPNTQEFIVVNQAPQLLNFLYSYRAPVPCGLIHSTV